MSAPLNEIRDIARNLNDIAKSLRILSGRDTNRSLTDTEGSR